MHRDCPHPGATAAPINFPKDILPTGASLQNCRTSAVLVCTGPPSSCISEVLRCRKTNSLTSCSQEIDPPPRKRFRSPGAADHRKARMYGGRARGTKRQDLIFRGELGSRAIGYKTAGTNPASRAHLQRDAPSFGRLHDGMASHSPAALPFAPDCLRVRDPKIAIEIDHDLMSSGAPLDTMALSLRHAPCFPASKSSARISTHGPRPAQPNGLRTMQRSGIGSWACR